MSFSMLSKPEAASWTAFSSALVVKLLMLSFRLQPVVMRSTAIVGAITPWEEEKEKMEGCKRGEKWNFEVCLTRLSFIKVTTSVDCLYKKLV